MIREPDSHANYDRDADRYYGFAPDDAPSEPQYDHDDDPDFGKRGKQLRRTK